MNCANDTRVKLPPARSALPSKPPPEMTLLLAALLPRGADESKLRRSAGLGVGVGGNPMRLAEREWRALESSEAARQHIEASHTSVTRLIHCIIAIHELYHQVLYEIIYLPSVLNMYMLPRLCYRLHTSILEATHKVQLLDKVLCVHPAFLVKKRGIQLSM